MASAHRVVIVGGGFGGLYAARRLGSAPVSLTLIDRRNFHLFQGDRGAASSLAAVHHQEYVNGKLVAGRFPASALTLFGFRGHRLGLGYPAIGPARKSDLFADLVRGVAI